MVLTQSELLDRVWLGMVWWFLVLLFSRIPTGKFILFWKVRVREQQQKRPNPTSKIKKMFILLQNHQKGKEMLSERYLIIKLYYFTFIYWTQTSKASFSFPVLNKKPAQSMSSANSYELLLNQTQHGSMYNKNCMWDHGINVLLQAFLPMSCSKWCYLFIPCLWQPNKLLLLL